jgi:hypothetical protein
MTWSLKRLLSDTKQHGRVDEEGSEVDLKVFVKMVNHFTNEHKTSESGWIIGSGEKAHIQTMLSSSSPV